MQSASKPGLRPAHLWLFAGFILSLLIFTLVILQPQRRTAVAVAKGDLIHVDQIGFSQIEAAAIALARANPSLNALLGGDRAQLIAVDRLAISQLPASSPHACYLDGCHHITYYQLDRAETVEAIIDLTNERVVAYWTNPNSRPRASRHLVPRLLAIAAQNKEVTNLIGDPTQLDMVMVPMSTWLSDDACGLAWCIDLTFPSPAGDGRILHVTINMEEERVARLFYTRGRVARQDNDPVPEASTSRYTDGCHEEFGWQVCWEMTAHDGLNFYDITFNDQLILTSSKIAQVEVYYAAWPGGYRDEIGFNASVLPKFDTRVTSFADESFEVRQMFSEEFDWPNCVCCYRYDQIMRFYADGSFENRFVSYGPGCDDLSSYRPFWRLDLALADAETNNVYLWDDAAGDWREVATEEESRLFAETAPSGDLIAVQGADLTYLWTPVQTDPVGLDEGRLFLVQRKEEEGTGPIEAGPADTFIPPLQWLDDEPLSGQNVVLWYIPFLKTKKAEPWFCMPDPAPDFSPCEAILRAAPADGLTQPEVVAPVQTDVTAEAEPTAAASPAPTATPRPIPGTEPQEIIENAGCGACHVIGPLGEAGKVGPDLSNIGAAAAMRVPGMTAADYLRQSLVEPNAFIVAECPNGPCAAGAMPAYGERLSHTQQEILVAYMLRLQYEVQVTPLAAAPAPTATAAAGQLPLQEVTENASLLIPMAAAVVLVFITVGLIAWRRAVINGEKQPH